MQKINLDEKFERIHEHWFPKIAGQLNGQYLKLAKFKGEFVWHLPPSGLSTPSASNGLDVTSCDAPSPCPASTGLPAPKPSIKASLLTTSPSRNLSRERPSTSSSFAVGRPSRAAPQHLIPSKEPECGRFIDRVLTQIPEPRKHGLHYFGAYASSARALREKHALKLEPASVNHSDAKTVEPELSSKQRAALRKRWANLIRRVFKTDPLLCECGGTFRVISFITAPNVIRRILDHLTQKNSRSRAPPNVSLDAHYS